MSDKIQVEYGRTIRLLFVYVLIGLAVGVLSIVFQQIMSVFNILLIEGITGHGETRIVWGARRLQLPWPRPEPVRWWLFPVLGGLGGLVTGAIVYRFAPEAAGHGTDEVILAYHCKQGEVRLRTSVVKMIASAITLGSGGSGGKEGPIAQIGAGFASYAATRFPILREYRREIMLAGMAAGIAAVFRAPLAASIFATEILYSEMKYEGRVLVPAVIASAASFGVYTLYFGFNPVFLVPAFVYSFSLLDLIPFTLLGVVAALSAIGFVKVFYAVRDLFVKLPIPRVLKPAIGGVLTGLLAIGVPQILGEGSFQLQKIIDGRFAVGWLAVILVCKVLATSFSIGSGGSGGVFAPSLFAGATLGGVFGGLFLMAFPESGIPLIVFVLLGMVSFFSGAANAPLSTVIIVAEMTRTFSLLAPFLWVSVFGYLFSQKWNIYENQVPLQTGILDSMKEPLGCPEGDDEPINR